MNELLYLKDCTFSKNKKKWTIKIITGPLKNNNNNNDDFDRAETNKTHFHKKGYALGLILKVKVLELVSGLLDLKHFRHPSDEQLRLTNTLYFKQQQFAICPL